MLQLYTLFNIEQNLYGTPMYFFNDDQAKIEIALWFTPERIEHANPENYDLYQIGLFDEKKGVLIPEWDNEHSHIFITNCSDLIPDNNTDLTSATKETIENLKQELSQ